MSVQIEELVPGVWNLEFGYGNTVYVIEGHDKAVVIDTGMGDEPILPLIRKLTGKPLELAITHVHGDHMRWASDFSVRYMCDKDVDISEKMLERFNMPEIINLTYHQVHEWDIINLGDVTLQVIPMYGHTPGSVGYYCKEKNIIFCGDALGSGMGVWMHVPYALNLREYRKTLKYFIDWAKNQPSMKFFSGHRIMNYAVLDFEKTFLESMQEAEVAWKNKIPVIEPNLEMVQNLYELCGDILADKITGVLRNDMSRKSSEGEIIPLVAVKDNAAILYTKDLI